MYEIENQTYFYLLIVIPILLLAYLILSFWKRKAQRHFSSQKMLYRLAPFRSKSKPLLKLSLIILFFIALTIALANPKIGTAKQTVKREGVDVVFAVDVSKSMEAVDIAPSRIDKAKLLISEVIKQLVGDRIGIIVYASQAYPQLPITTDYSAANMFLEGINTDMMSSQGTAIKEAIDLATTFYDDDGVNKILFIISDGEDHMGSSFNEIEKAKLKGIKIYTIGVGTTKGAPIPIRIKGINTSYKKDRQGQVVITKLDEATLNKIAKKSGGSYINGANTKAVKNFVENILENTDKTEFQTQEFTDYKSQFQWFLTIALFALVLDIFLFEGKTLWVSRLNLFNEKSKDN